MTPKMEHTSLLHQLGFIRPIDEYYRVRRMPTGAELREAQEKHHREVQGLMDKDPDKGQTQ